MAELTISQIKEKQKQLQKDIKNLLEQFHEETTLIVRGEINFGYTDNKDQHYLLLKYDNPF